MSLCGGRWGPEGKKDGWRKKQIKKQLWIESQRNRAVEQCLRRPIKSQAVERMPVLDAHTLCVSLFALFPDSVSDGW